MGGTNLDPIRKRPAILLFLALLAGTPCQAGFYAHGSFGFGKYTASGDYMGSKSTDRLKARDLPLTLGIGYRFSDWFATDLSHVEMDAIPSPASFVRYGVDGRGQRLSLQGELPLSDNANLFLRGGPFQWDVSVKPSFEHGSDRFDGRDHFLGAGFRFVSGTRASAVVAYERYRIQDIDLDIIQLGVEVSFGKR